MSDVLAFWGEWFPSLLDGLVISVEVTGVCLLIGIPLGLLLALGVQAKTRPPRWLALAVVEIGRGAPALILLQFAYFGLPSAGRSLSSFVAPAPIRARSSGKGSKPCRTARRRRPPPSV